MLLLIFLILCKNIGQEIDIKNWVSYLNKNTFLLLCLVILIPVNIGLECAKWHIILHPSIRLSKKELIGSVLVGYSVGFIMPNRLGSFIGRILFLYPDKRYEGSLKSMYNNFAQQLITLAAGTFVIHQLLNYKEMAVLDGYTIFFFILITLTLHLLYFIPSTFIVLLRKLFNTKMKNALDQLNQVHLYKRILIYLLSLIRYGVFTLQFVIALYVFELELSFNEAITGVLLTFLLTSIIPVLFLGKFLVRESVAIFIFSFWTLQDTQVFYASTLIWMANLVLPSLIGGIVLLNKRIKWR